MIEGKFRKLPTPPRTRYVEDSEIVQALSLEPRRKRGSVHAVRAYIKIKLLTGLRRGDLLRLRKADLQDDGIHVQPRKTAKTTGKRLIIEWTPALRQAVDEALAARPVDIAPWVFCTRRGDPYVDEDGSARAWDSMWQRFMDRVLAETEVNERFTEHDLRAKCASDAESLAHAQQLLAHASSATTKRIYRRKPERVKPLR
jgi:integrase